MLDIFALLSGSGAADIKKSVEEAKALIDKKVALDARQIQLMEEQSESLKEICNLLTELVAHKRGY